MANGSEKSIESMMATHAERRAGIAAGKKEISGGFFAGLAQVGKAASYTKKVGGYMKKEARGKAQAEVGRAMSRGSSAVKGAGRTVGAGGKMGGLSRYHRLMLTAHGAAQRNMTAGQIKRAAGGVHAARKRGEIAA